VDSPTLRDVLGLSEGRWGCSVSLPCFACSWIQSCTITRSLEEAFVRHLAPSTTSNKSIQTSPPQTSYIMFGNILALVSTLAVIAAASPVAEAGPIINDAGPKISARDACSDERASCFKSGESQCGSVLFVQRLIVRRLRRDVSFRRSLYWPLHGQIQVSRCVGEQDCVRCHRSQDISTHLGSPVCPANNLMYLLTTCSQRLRVQQMRPRGRTLQRERL
jgi:hypothetical protein